MLLDPIEDLNLYSDDYPMFDDNFVLDTNQELPIRKPQSAYVIFGKLVSEINIMSIQTKSEILEKRLNHEIKPWNKSHRSRQIDS